VAPFWPHDTFKSSSGGGAAF